MSGTCLRKNRLNDSGRLMRPISYTSRKPLVVTRAVSAPLRSRMALMTTVEPCSPPFARARSPPAAAIARRMPSTRSRGVLDHLPSRSCPLLSSNAATSVKVPPMSTAMRSVAVCGPASGVIVLILVHSLGLESVCQIPLLIVNHRLHVRDGVGLQTRGDRLREQRSVLHGRLLDE